MSGTASATNGNVINLLGEGTYRDYDGTAAFLPDTAGRIRAEELAQGHIDHAITATALCFNGNVYPAGWGSETQCSDATKPTAHPGQYLKLAQYAPPIGARFVYTKTWADIDRMVQTQNLSPWKATVLKAMSRYGIILNDGAGGGFELQQENGFMYTNAGGADQWRAFGFQNLSSVGPDQGWVDCQQPACTVDTYIGKLFTGNDQDRTTIDLAHNLVMLNPCASWGRCP